MMVAHPFDRFDRDSRKYSYFDGAFPLTFRRDLPERITPTVDPQEHDGYKSKYENGEFREWILVDGEWEEITSKDEEESDTGLRVSESGVTVDLSDFDVSSEFEAVSEVTFNNGILSVTFETEVESEEK